jgi:hypothetical protein
MKGNFDGFIHKGQCPNKPFEKERHIFLVFLKRNGMGAFQSKAWIGYLCKYTFARVFFFFFFNSVVLSVTWCD